MSSRDCPCGAVRVDAQLGLEATPDAYVASMVAVFREVWRVLKPGGTVWLNLGDTFAANRTYQVTDNKHVDVGNSSAMRVPLGLKPKDLVGIPWRVAFALQADGWYLRSDIIWSKPAPMPESVRDRPTKSHEYIFLLAKQPSYFFDADAVAETAVGGGDFGLLRTKTGVGLSDGVAWHAPSIAKRQATGVDSRTAGAQTRNIRSVWTINSQPYSGAHFATFPEKLVERCVLAGSKSGDVVLDPFVGSGTVARVALRLGRRAIGCDLNPAYLKLADDRTRVTYGLPLEVA